MRFTQGQYSLIMAYAETPLARKEHRITRIDEEEGHLNRQVEKFYERFPNWEEHKQRLLCKNRQL